MKTKHFLVSTIVAVVAALLFAACNKKDETDGINENITIYGKVPVLIISKSDYYTSHKTTYTYDDKNQLIAHSMLSIDTTGNVVPNRGFDYEYSYENDSLVKIEVISHENNDKYTTTVLSSSATQVKVVNVFTQRWGTYADTVIYDLDSKGQVVKHERVKYTYADNGTMVKFEDESTIPTCISEYTYDDKNGIYKNVNMPTWCVLSYMSIWNAVHNVISEESFCGDTANNFFAKIKYDIDDYPIEIRLIQEKDSSLNMVDSIVYNK